MEKHMLAKEGQINNHIQISSETMQEESGVKYSNVERISKIPV